MQLSKDAVHLLRWLCKNDQWLYLSQIETKNKRFSYRSFQALEKAKYIDSTVFEEEIPEYDEYGESYYPKHYRISDLGKAYLEDLPRRWLPEFREWIAIGISVVALIVSVIALILGQAQ